MRSAMSIRPVPSSQTQGPAAASSLMCWGGLRAARSIAHTFTEMDWPGRPGVPGGLGRRGSRGPPLALVRRA